MTPYFQQPAMLKVVSGPFEVLIVLPLFKIQACILYFILVILIDFETQEENKDSVCEYK